MKIAVCVFFDYQLGGVGTQAFDMAMYFRERGIESDVVTFTERMAVAPPMPEPKFEATRDGKNLRLRQVEVSMRPERWAFTLKTLKQYSGMVWIGCAPHIKARSEQADLFLDLLMTRPVVGFVTDRYIDDLYRWVSPHLKNFSGLFAFADPYQSAVGKYAKCELMPIAPRGAWMLREHAFSHKRNGVLWPHQWRGWKNIELFLETVAGGEAGTVTMYGSGNSREYAAFRKSKAYSDSVSRDAHNTWQSNKSAPLALLGYRPQEEVLQAYLTHAVCPDLTGVSSKLVKPNSYVGNYQCATLEAMCLGCPLVKFTTTVHPHNAIPAETAVLLQPNAENIKGRMLSAFSDVAALHSAAKNALDWVNDVCAPDKHINTIIERLK